MPAPSLPAPLEAYLQARRVERNLARSSTDEYRRDLYDFCRWLGAQLGKEPEQIDLADLAQVDRDQARSWLAHLKERELADSTLARRLSAVGSMFRWMASEGKIPHDPFATVRPPASGNRHTRLVVYLNPDQVTRLLEIVRSDEGLTPRQVPTQRRLQDRDYALITLLLYQGLRIGEASRLRLGDVDFAEATLRVLGKGDKERLLPLHNRSLEALTRYLDTWDGRRRPEQPQDPLWWSLNGRPLTRDAARAMVKRHLVRAGLWRASPHKLRHTFGTRLVEAGVDLLVVRDLLGHASVATTQIYTHVATRRLRDAIDQLP